MIEDWQPKDGLHIHGTGKGSYCQRWGPEIESKRDCGDSSKPNL